MLYKKVLKPMLFRMSPENVHDHAIIIGRIAGSNPGTRKALKSLFYYEHPSLHVTVDNVTYKNPVGLAAGFDKDCKLMRTLPAISFGFEEVGSITAEGYKGNKGPRLVRLPEDKSIIVYYGLKNKGAVKLRKRLLKNGVRRKFDFPIGISVAKTNKEFFTMEEKIADWTRGIELLKDCGDYMTINVSCPNTYDPQNFNDPELLNTLLAGIQARDLDIRVPVYLKLSADVSFAQLDEIIAICDNYRFVKGFILTNLVKDRSKVKLKSPARMHENYKGGLSGKVVYPYALALVRHAYAKAGDRYTIIGCGGIFDAKDAYEYIKSGASLVQLITGMIYNGPKTVKRINQGLVELLKQDGYKHISEAVGTDIHDVHHRRR